MLKSRGCGGRFVAPGFRVLRFFELQPSEEMSKTHLGRVIQSFLQSCRMHVLLNRSAHIYIQEVSLPVPLQQGRSACGSSGFTERTPTLEEESLNSARRC